MRGCPIKLYFLKRFAMKNSFDRRRFLLSLGALGILPKSGLALAGEGAAASSALIAAAWRGPNPGDTYYAGVLAANWESKKLEIRYATALPTRPHGLLPEADGGLLVTGVRPGSWLLRCDGNGEVTQQINLDLHHRNRQQKRSRQDRRA